MKGDVFFKYIIKLFQAQGTGKSPLSLDMRLNRQVVIAFPGLRLEIQRLGEMHNPDIDIQVVGTDFFLEGKTFIAFKLIDLYFHDKLLFGFLFNGFQHKIRNKRADVSAQHRDLADQAA